MSLALVKSAKAISAQRLEDADVNVCVVELQKCFALHAGEAGKLFDVEIEQLLAQLRRQIGLGIVEQGSDVVLKRPLASALIVEKKRLPVNEHDVAGLEIAVKEIVAVGAQQEICQALEIVFQSLLVEGNSRQPQKVILEIIQIPGDRLPVEDASRIAHLVIQIASSFDLKPRQQAHNPAIRFHRVRSDILSHAILREKLEKSGVSEVFLEISALTQIFRINFRHG